MTESKPVRISENARLPTREDLLVPAIVLVLIPITSFRTVTRAADIGVVLAVLFAPLGMAHLRRFGSMRRMAVLLLAAGASGLVLAQVAASNERRVTVSYEFGMISFTVAGAALLVTVAWSSRFHSLRFISITFSLGLIADGLLDTGSWQGNAWKFVFAWPVAMLLLSFANQRRSRAVGALAGVALVSGSLGDRSVFGIALLVCVLVIAPRGALDHSHRRIVIARRLAAVALAAAGIYQLGSYLAVHGELGRDVQASTVEELNRNPSLIGSGRPEGSAALALFRSSPLGLGPGVSPDSEELEVAQNALRNRGVDASSAYVTDYMFGGHAELHSIAGDLWVNFGIPGLLASAYAGWILLAGLLRFGRTAPPFVLFASVSALWDILFSPLSATFLRAVFAVGLVSVFGGAQPGASRRAGACGKSAG